MCAATEEKSDDSNDIVYGELHHIFDDLPK
jgi:hypothetical protein